MKQLRGFYAVLDRDDPALARTLLAAGARVLQVLEPATAAEQLAVARAARELLR